MIDGKLDDPAWEDAAVIDRFPAFWDRHDTGHGTRAWLVWDDDALYFAATMTDAELRSFGTKRNDTPLEGRRLRAVLQARAPTGPSTTSSRPTRGR